MIFARPTRRERRAYDRLRRRTTVNGRHSTVASPEAHSWALAAQRLFGPAFTPGSLSRPSRTVTIGPPSRRLWRRDGEPIGGHQGCVASDPSSLVCRTGFQPVSKFDRLQTCPTGRA